MDNRKIFMRTSLILQRLQKSPATLKEINTYLERNSNQYGEEFSVSQRTIGRDLDKIRSMHQIDIVYDYSRKLYLIDKEGQPEVNKRMMESIDILNAMHLADGMTGLILFENRQSSGTENLYGLLHSIKNQYQISFNYQKYFEKEKTHRVVEPYGLREYRNRWYLVVKESKKGEEEYIKNFGLDRITDLEITKSISTCRKISTWPTILSLLLETSFPGRMLRQTLFYPSLLTRENTLNQPLSTPHNKSLLTMRRS